MNEDSQYDMGTDMELCVFERELLHRWYERRPSAHPTVRMLLAKDAAIWRISFDPSGAVSRMYVGFPDREHATITTTPENLPGWVQERIAALNVFGDNLPTPYVDGVGRRINKSTYYVEE
jgi:hypothetical protein